MILFLKKSTNKVLIVLGEGSFDLHSKESVRKKKKKCNLVGILQ